MSPLDRFLETYQALTRDRLHLLARIYSQEVRFRDPVHEIRGIAALQRYFSELYRAADKIRFTFQHHHHLDNKAYVQWEMTFCHPRLAGGRTIQVPGLSYLQFDGSGKVYDHRDYFDLGAMLYEHLPLLGTLVKTIKRRLRT